MDIHQTFLTELPADVQNLVATILESRSLQRLKKISFLGAIDRFSPTHAHGDSVSSGSRFDHSVGVANIMLAISDRMNLSAGELRLAIANALLHDIGHGPYSHSSEPFFSKVFDIDHHKALHAIVEDEGSEVSRILKKFGLWIDYRRFIRSPASIPAVERLFYGPINIDTIEGIIRSAKFFQIDTSLDLSILAQSIGRPHVPIRPLDRFWNLKSAVYNEHIFASRYAYYDEALTGSLHSMRQMLRLEHFYLDDESFEKEFGDGLQRSFFDEHSRVTVRRASRVRTFRINKEVAPRQFNSLDDRYNEVRGSNDGRAKHH
jgi:hypothetical protein